MRLFEVSIFDQFINIFKDAVESRLISDVPVGTYNSGGVDSSLVTAVAKSFKQNELHTFSVGFEERSHDESKYAKIVSAKYGTNHHNIVVKQSEYISEIEKTLWYLEEPINHPHTVQLKILSRVAREFVTVVLTGEGADELFAGYPRYNIAKLFKIIQLIPKTSFKPIAPFLNTLNMRRILKIFEALDYDDEELVTTLVKGNVEITNIKGAPEKEFNLIVNDQLIFNRFDQSIKLQKVDAKVYCSWTEGSFIFENESLEKIFHKLERWYDINVFFIENDARYFEFTGVLPRHESFKVILKMLETTSDVEFNIKGQTISISVK